MRILSLTFLIVLLIGPSSLEVRAQGIDVIRPTGKWVTDLADMMSSSEERQLSQKLATYNDTTSTQIIVVTLPSLDGIPESDYAIELGRQWAVGQAGQNNGVVILATRDDRRLFIATGYGLEGAIPDIVANRIVQDIMIPNFRQGRFYNGFDSAADALILAARGEFTASPQGSSEGLDPDTLRLLIWIAIFIIIISIRNNNSSGGKRYRRRGGFPTVVWGPTIGGGGGGSFGGGGFGGGGFGGFSGGGGSFGGGGAGGGW